MRVHHLDCGTMCPFGGSLVDSRSASPLAKATMVCHVLAVETERHGVVLVDTGIGLGDIADPRGRLGGHFTTLLRPMLDPKETARAQIEALGFSADDVRHIVPTHMDLDHAGGLGDFPKATVHLFAKEHRAAIERASFLERQRYRPAQWAHAPRFETYEVAGEPWKGFPCVRELRGLPPEILIVPLVGHSRGHSGVAVDTGTGWLLHAGDAYFSSQQLEDPPRCPPALALFQHVVAVDREMMRANQARLRELGRDHGDVTIFSAHDPGELARLA
jgi:glyoxylase-like metal-dependent hydrolase (beta-lactamase superfamily II)